MLYLQDVPEGAIFSIIGLRSKPLLRVKGGYFDMNTFEVCEMVINTEDPDRCKLLGDDDLKRKYAISQLQLEAWKEHVHKMYKKKFSN